MQKTDAGQRDGELILLLLNGANETKKMEPRSLIRAITLFCVFLAIAGILVFGYYCQNQVCAFTKRGIVLQTDLHSYSQAFASPNTFLSSGESGASAASQQQISSNTKSPIQINMKAANVGVSYDDVLNDDFQFDMERHDVMVFLHIQKTGGTSFGRHLVHDLDLKRPCDCQWNRKRCYCFRPHRNENWLFSRYSTGWRCGLHADWTELTSCVDSELDKNEGETTKRRYFYITMLREPIARYLSEYRHVRRGATWKGSRHWCLGRQASAVELPPCYDGEDWLDVELDDFASCESNLATNRQTRMMADLALVGCYNKTSMPAHERERVMLASAKNNLAAMAYFGLTEYQKISQYIFEETFNLRFSVPFEQNNGTISSIAVLSLRSDQKTRIAELNNLDIELYEFAKELLFQRFNRLRTKDVDFKTRFANLGSIFYKQSSTSLNRDSGAEDNFITYH